MIRKGHLARKGLSRKVLLSAMLVSIAATVAGVGAFATFTDTASVNQANTSGTVTLNPISASGANNRLSIGATNIASADWIERAVNIKNTGNIDLADVKLTTTAPVTSSLLDIDVTDGLQMLIEKCSVAWTEAGAGPPYTYTCSGTTSTALASTSVIGANRALANLSLTAGDDNFLRVKLTLPGTAGNTFKGLASTINYAFTATQRAGQAK
ncbi:MAG: CalY family protein [Acidimicrobiia bacterium]|nr:CalY family protein [Acidimicrobiia bacterium]